MRQEIVVLSIRIKIDREDFFGGVDDEVWIIINSEDGGGVKELEVDLDKVDFNHIEALNFNIVKVVVKDYGCLWGMILWIVMKNRGEV